MNGQDFRALLNTLDTVETTVNLKEQWIKWGEFLKESNTVETLDEQFGLDPNKDYETKNYTYSFLNTHGYDPKNPIFNRIFFKNKGFWYDDDTGEIIFDEKTKAIRTYDINRWEMGTEPLIPLEIMNALSKMGFYLDLEPVVMGRSSSELMDMYNVRSKGTVEEAETKTKTQAKVDSKVFEPAEKGEIQAKEPAEKGKRKRAKQVTLKKSVPVPNLAHIGKTIGKADSDDDYGDLEMNAPQLELEPTLALGQDTDTDTTDLAVNAPSKKETEIAQRIHNVEWHNMMDLPGNMHQVIRNMGRRVFSAFGEQDFEDIDVVASITNNEEDLDAVAGLVRQFGVPVVKDNIVDFGDTIPGYKAHAGVWAFANQYYMFVKDDFGEYIYTWNNTETDKLQHFEPVSRNKDQARLEGINEDRNPFIGRVANDPLVNVSYKGYTYDPEIEEDDDSRKLIHHITDPHGAIGVAPEWFMNITPYEYPTPAEFKRAVDEIETNKN